MKVFLAVFLCFLAVIHDTYAAGRAFPIESENFAKELFYQLKWDPTNFLIDLSGRYAGCEFRGQMGTFRVDRTTKEGERIQGVRGQAPSSGASVDAVNLDIVKIVKPWAKTYFDTVKNADKFGCSVRPECNGQTIVVCLFTAISGIQEQTTRRPLPRPTARAFTPQQYKLTEGILNMQWDRSHLLENLAGTVTKCNMMGMVGHNTQDIETVEKEATRMTGRRVEARYGHAMNRGETEPAMMEIIDEFSKLDEGYKLGCALLPDCTTTRGGSMYVIVTCLFEQY